jgi:hypothetical protein
MLTASKFLDKSNPYCCQREDILHIEKEAGLETLQWIVGIPENKCFQNLLRRKAPANNVFMASL